MCTFDSCGRFLSLQSLSLFFGNKLLSAKKRKDHCEMATDCSFAKNLSPKNAIAFLRWLSCQTIGFLECLSAKFNPNYYYGRENQNNSACQSNQALIEYFAEDIDFMSSVHFKRISLLHFDRRTKKHVNQINRSLIISMPLLNSCHPFSFRAFRMIK